MADEIKQPNTSEIPSVSNVIKRGNDIYEKKKAEIEILENLGKYVSIEVDSGKIFIASTRDEAVAEARKVYPLPTILFVKRIGGADRSSRNLHSQQVHARVF